MPKRITDKFYSKFKRICRNLLDENLTEERRAFNLGLKSGMIMATNFYSNTDGNILTRFEQKIIKKRLKQLDKAEKPHTVRSVHPSKED